jgi:hypothetical protein
MKTRRTLHFLYLATGLFALGATTAVQVQARAQFWRDTFEDSDNPSGVLRAPATTPTCSALLKGSGMGL